MNGSELEVVQPMAIDLSISRSPAEVVKEAREAAQVLRDVISQKDKPVIFNGQQYLEFEDWQTVAKFYNVTAKVRSTHFVQFGDVVGYEAEAEAILVTTGIVISAAESQCLNDEERWSARPKYEWQTVDGRRTRVKVGEERVPLFQLKSMAQTRACAKALRNVFSWVVVLAGYRPTPAEEMTGNEDRDEPRKPTRDELHERQMPERKSATTAPATPKPAAVGGDAVISEGQRKRFFAIWKGNGIPEDIVKAKMKEAGYEHSADIKKIDYDDLCTWAEKFGQDAELPSDYDDGIA